MTENCGFGPFLVDKIQIGRDGNILYTNPNDGSLWIDDSSFGSIRFRDLLGQSVVINPAIIITIEIGDWIPISIGDQTFYTVDIPHNYNIAIEGYYTSLLDKTGHQLSLHEVLQTSNTVTLTSILPLELYVQIRKI